MTHKQQVPEAVADLVAEFTDWRRRKRHDREAIPDALWTKAVTLARKHAPGMVARHLGLTPRSLAARMHAAPLRAKPIRMARVALKPSTSSTACVSPQSTSAAMEIVSPTGALLRVAAGDVTQIIKAFVEACR